MIKICVSISVGKSAIKQSSRLSTLDPDVVDLLKKEGYDDEVNELLGYSGQKLTSLPSVISKFPTTEIDNPEWWFVMVDSQDNILLGIKRDGYLYGVKNNQLIKL